MGITNEQLNQGLIDSIKIECEALQTSCRILNQSPAFVKSVSQQLSGSNIMVRAEHILLQDLANIYHNCKLANSANENKISKFLLAFYFDYIKGDHKLKDLSLGQIQALTNSQSINDYAKDLISTISNNFHQIYITTLLTEIKSDHLKSFYLHFYRFASFIIHSDGPGDPTEENYLSEFLKNSTHQTFVQQEIENDTLEKALADLNALIGLQEVKSTVSDIINFLKIQKARDKEKLPRVNNSLHSVFLGPPGTGKTTVARIMARIYKHLGIISKGHLVEVDRSSLVAGFVGQTAIKVDEVVKSALGGVLFIDEAYSLTSNQSMGNDYGKEVLEVLLKRMEDYRDQFVVIVAGYTEEMQTFIESNPGLKSRFSQYIYFAHYTPQELLEIFKFTCKKYSFSLDQDAEEKILDILEMADKQKGNNYGNAREVRNLFEEIVRLQANRLVQLQVTDAKTLSEIHEEDVPSVKETVKRITTYWE
jgi:stage V sporulation protein K